MKLIRLTTSETVSLEDGFLWSDEFEWKPKEQTVERAISGAAIIQEGIKVGARPITLTPDSNRGWAKLSDVRKLQEWSAASRPSAVIYSWQPGLVRQIVAFEPVRVEKIPEYLMLRFGKAVRP